ncbi:LTA synthase family protein [Clostridium sp. MSJ-11]|uniref:LTA synthase family protein n=1 Tax=Clostridium mobile TaxID=2841512 RepID=A0ABS6EDW9_9CLOT|nr:LTA synthase family protein [Clostridium mobile]MBU5483342.1 LTA synthase family protein [Clostridium mobile]
MPGLDLISFIFTVTIKLLFFGKEIEKGYFTYKSIFIPVLSSVLLFAAIGFLFNKDKRFKIYTIFNIIITLFIVADLNYFRYFKDLISLPIILNGFQLGAVKNSVGNLLKATDFLYFIDIFIFLIIHKLYKGHKLPAINFKTRAIISIALLLVGVTGNAIKIYDLSKEQPRLLSSMYNKVYVATKLGGVNYHLLDSYNVAVNSISKKIPISKETKEAMSSFLINNSKKSSENLKGIGDGKNLIMIQVEALQGFAIDKTILGKEITPNLNKLMKRSAYFNNYFYQTASGGTSDAEFISNNSLYPTPSGSVTYLYTNNEFNALPEALAKKGYNTSAFHGFRDNFWNRNIMFPKYGFQEFHGEKDYNIDETMGLGLSDESFFKQSLKKMDNLKEPYYSFLVTLTSHFPYEDTEKYGDFPVGEFEGTLLGNYLKSIHYTDKQLGMFIDELEKNETLDNSILVLYGDHYAIPKENKAELAKFLGVNDFTELQWMELNKVPLMIHFPQDQHKGVYEIYSGQVDLYPTLANIFNLPAENMMGKDLFNSKEGKVIFRNGSFTNGEVFYLSQDNSFYDMNTGNKIPENEKLTAFKESVINELEYSDLILRYNLLK